MPDMRIGGAVYRVTRKMDLFRQMEVGSKALPLLTSGASELLPIYLQFRAQGLGSFNDLAVDHLGQILTPIARELAKLSDADRRLIIGSALDLIDRKEDSKDGWHRVWNPEAGRAMFEDVQSDMGTVLRLTLFSLHATYQSFLPASLSDWLGGAKAA